MVRIAAILAGLMVGVGALGAHLVSGRPLGAAAIVALYLAVTLLVWGVNGFAFRRLPLSGAALFLFSAATFGVLFLLGYLLGGVAGPFLIDAANRAVPYLKLADAVFYLFAVMTCFGAAGCAFSRNIIYSAWSLLFALLGAAGLYVFLGADFPAVAQVLIYVGGVLVLILFAIMLTKQIGEDPKLTNTHVGFPAGVALAIVTIATLTYTAVMAPWKVAAERSWEPTAQRLGIAFLTDYLLPFEVASVVLLAALIGAVVIARKEIKETSDVST
ncbi:MAG TPA: NADH-quinone oxidoreductase subunit J [Myxococcales bacterium]|nr:NADH-quinone oxidoreductase subunit J [Myxococcales bacterium]